MNGFEKHGIKHLSPSSINMYAECAGAWAARYIFKKRFKFGVAAQVGVLTEKVVQDVLLGQTFDTALGSALKTFDRDNALNTSEKDLKRRPHIEIMAELALGELKQYGEPEFIRTLNGVDQQKISITCKGHGWDMPVIGYLDFVYPKHGLVVDLKTTQRMPSVMSLAHQRQAAIYSAAKGNMGVKFLYVTPKKTGWLEVENEKNVLNNTKAIASRMEKMLSLLSADQMRELLPVNSGSFYWGGEDKTLNELYGL